MTKTAEVRCMGLHNDATFPKISDVGTAFSPVEVVCA